MIPTYTTPSPIPGVALPGLWLKRLLLVVGVFVFFVILSSAGYYVIEGDYTVLDSVYMTVITIATVGYREIGSSGQLSKMGQVWTIFVILGGIVTGAVALSVIAGASVEAMFRSVFGRRQMERRIAAMSGHVIVCGYGRMGQAVVGDLRQAEKDLLVVEILPERVQQAEAGGIACLPGDAQEDEVLQAAGIDRASALVALLPDDTANVFLVLTARGLSESVRIIARAEDVTNTDKLRKAGASRVICAKTIGANRIVDLLLRPAMVEFVEQAHEDVELEMEHLTLKKGSWMVGRSLRELALPPRIRSVVVAVRSGDGSILYTPDPGTKLAPGDTLVLLGSRGAAEAIDQLPPPSAAAEPPPAEG